MTGAATVTVAAAVASSTKADPATTTPSRRMTVARGFARHMAGVDLATEVPPAGLLASRARWRPPFIYTPLVRIQPTADSGGRRNTWW